MDEDPLRKSELDRGTLRGLASAISESGDTRFGGMAEEYAK